MATPADPVVSPADTPEWDERLLRAIGVADRASTSMTPYGPMNDKWMRGFLDALADEGLAIVDAALLAVGERDKADPLEGANCSICGATADNFHVPDELWERVGLGHVQACFKCFRIAAWHAGVRNDGKPWEVTAGERDRRQIARLTEALRVARSYVAWCEIEWGTTEDGQEATNVLAQVDAVLADEEDENNG